MAERKITLVCAFDFTSPRMSAYEIHEWIFEELQIPEPILIAIKIDSVKRCVCISRWLTRTMSTPF